MLKLKIIQQQAGHEYASTTVLYSCVSSVPHPHPAAGAGCHDDRGHAAGKGNGKR